jgi:adenine deaminase
VTRHPQRIEPRRVTYNNDIREVVVRNRATTSVVVDVEKVARVGGAEDIRWGRRTDDELCLAVMLIAPS